jgi:diadenylate cyclase
VEAVRCTLPLSSETAYETRALGMRHRAGLGISEQADVISVIVSEETGSISIAEHGKMISGLSKEGLRNYLINAMRVSKQSGFRTFIGALKNKRGAKRAES